MNQFKGIKHNLLFVTGNPNSQQFQDLSNAVQTGGALHDQFLKNNIVLQSSCGSGSSGSSGSDNDSNEFNMTLYGMDGQSKYLANQFNDQAVQDILSITQPVPMSQQTGGGATGAAAGPVDYKEKYLKYKRKYQEANSAILKLF